MRCRSLDKSGSTRQRDNPAFRARSKLAEVPVTNSMARSVVLKLAAGGHLTEGMRAL